MLLVIALAWRSKRSGNYPDVVVVDQVSAMVPLVKWLLGCPVLFYCHYPDYLLSRPATKIHRFYRRPIDWLEETSTGAADLVVVNSHFTQGVFAKAFPRLAARGVVPEVLYPAVSIPTDAQLEHNAATWDATLPAAIVAFVRSHETIFLSINRFERKKNIGLAIEALALLLEERGPSAQSGPGLVVAGGYDPRLAENVEHLVELEELAARIGIAEHVAFLPSFSDAQRGALLAVCTAVLYTPTDEHFGIVPLEAGAAGRPVVACASGGPLETIVSGQTGELCAPDPRAWARALRRSSKGGAGAWEAMGRAGRRRVHQRFSRRAFGDCLEAVLDRLRLAGPRAAPAVRAPGTKSDRRRRAKRA